MKYCRIREAIRKWLLNRLIRDDEIVFDDKRIKYVFDNL